MQQQLKLIWLSHRGRAMLRVVGNFPKSLKVDIIRGWVERIPISIPTVTVPLSLVFLRDIQRRIMAYP